MAEKEAKDLGLSFKSLGEALEKFRNPVEAVKKEVTESIGTFNKLSATGNSFNNDIIGMKVAAANSRMTLDELGAVVTKSGKDFAGLGGSVTKGSQVFTDFSKTFFDSGLTENLRQMGYSSKDLNEVLALQIGAQKSTTDTSVAGQIRTAQAAASLAEEMDLISKLTGKSRKEQEEQLEATRRNGQIEAKFRLIGLTEGADAEKAARLNFDKQLAAAQAMGTEAVFKEMFATNTVRSKEAALQVALLGDAARETANSATALSKGNVAASEQAMEAAKVGNMNNQNNRALLSLTASGVGDAAGVMKKNIETNDAAYHGMVKTQKAAEAMGVQLNGTAEALKLQREAIKEEQKARHGITQAMIAVTARSEDAVAAIANQVVKPLNEGSIAKSAKKFAESDLMSQSVRAGDTTSDTAKQYMQSLRNQARLGGPEKAPASSRETIEGTIRPVTKPIVEGADKIVGGGFEALGKGAMAAKNFITDVMEVKNFNAKIPSRDAGTMGKTGQPFEPNDILAKIHKGEMVLTPEQAKNFMAGARTEGLTSAMNEMAKSMPKIDVSKMPGNVDVTTSISELKKSVEGKNQSIFDIGKSMSEMKKSVATPSLLNTAGGKPSKPTEFKMPSMDQISFGPDGMPRISAKPQAQAMAQQVAAERKEPAAPAPTAEAETTNQAATNQSTPADQPDPAGKSATLNDVVKELTNLNSIMAQVAKMTGDTNSLVERQVRATKAIGGNVYDRL
jgi:hypothetical protein